MSLNAWFAMTRGSVSYCTVTAGLPARSELRNAPFTRLSQLAVMMMQLPGMALVQPF